MATAGKNADITVANADGSTNKVRLSLWRDAPNRPGGWEEEIISPTPPPQPQGHVNSAAQSPEVGRVVAERAREAGVTSVVFDRGGYKYHGRVAALADAAREAGLEF